MLRRRGLPAIPEARARDPPPRSPRTLILAVIFLLCLSYYTEFVQQQNDLLARAQEDPARAEEARGEEATPTTSSPTTTREPETQITSSPKTDYIERFVDPIRMRALRELASRTLDTSLSRLESPRVDMGPALFPNASDVYLGAIHHPDSAVESDEEKKQNLPGTSHMPVFVSDVSVFGSPRSLVKSWFVSEQDDSQRVFLNRPEKTVDVLAALVEKRTLFPIDIRISMLHAYPTTLKGLVRCSGRMKIGGTRGASGEASSWVKSIDFVGLHSPGHGAMSLFTDFIELDEAGALAPLESGFVASRDGAHARVGMEVLNLTAAPGVLARMYLGGQSHLVFGARRSFHAEGEEEAREPRERIHTEEVGNVFASPKLTASSSEPTKGCALRFDLLTARTAMEDAPPRLQTSSEYAHLAEEDTSASKRLPKRLKGYVSCQPPPAGLSTTGSTEPPPPPPALLRLRVSLSGLELDVPAALASAGWYGVYAELETAALAALIYRFISTRLESPMEMSQFSVYSMLMITVGDAYLTLIFLVAGNANGESVLAGAGLAKACGLFFVDVIGLTAMYFARRRRYFAAETTPLQQVMTRAQLVIWMGVGMLVHLRQISPRAVGLLFVSFWVPQIVQNAVDDCADAPSRSNLYAFSLARLGYPAIILATKFTDTLAAADVIGSFDAVPVYDPAGVLVLLAWLGAQILALEGQRAYGSRFFIPKRLRPVKYSYKRAKAPNIDCVVCMMPIDRAKLSATTPCEHVFHPECLQSWIATGKLTCPTCRQPLPPFRMRDTDDEVSSEEEDDEEAQRAAAAESKPPDAPTEAIADQREAAAVPSRAETTG